MKAAIYNLELYRGADFDFTLRILDVYDEPVAFTGSTAFKAEIRPAPQRSLAAAFSFETVDGSGNSTVNEALAAGDLRFVLTDAQTIMLNSNVSYAWDFFWTDASGAVRKLLEGTVTVYPNVTDV